MAGKIPRYFIDHLLEHTDIVETVDARVRLKKSGANYSACCPFHQEKTPSFTVNADKQFYYCFGCGAGGNVISFLMDYERTSFVDTIENLAAAKGISVPYEDNPQYDKQHAQQRNIYDVLDKASAFYQHQLKEHPERSLAIDYLKKRGLSGEICKQFDIGFAPAGWDNLLKAMPEHSALLNSAGMLIERDDGHFYDRFRARLMFPIRDNRGRVIAFGGRVFNDDKPKYLNSPETAVFHKQNELYGLWQARQANRHLTRLIIVEGYMDVVALAQFGISNAVATLGTAAGAAHLEKAFRHTSEVVFCFDGDNAGRKAADRALNIALPLMQDGRHIRFLFLPEGQDPDSWVREIGAQQFNWHIEQAVNLSSFLFSSYGQGLNLQTPDDKAVLIQRLTPAFQQLPDNAFKSLLLQKLSDDTGLSLDKLNQFLAAQPVTHTPEANNTSSHKPPVKKPKLSLAEQRLQRTSVRVASALLMFNPHFAQITAPLDQLIQADTEELAYLLSLQQFCLDHPDTRASSLLGYCLHKYPDATSRLLRTAIQAVNAMQLEKEYRDAIAHIAQQQQHSQQAPMIEQLGSKPFKDYTEQDKAAFLQFFQSHSTKP